MFLQHREHGVYAEGHDDGGIDTAPPDEEDTDEYQAGDGLKDGQNRDDDAGQPPGDPGQQDAQHQSYREADGHGYQYVDRVLADSRAHFGAVIVEEGLQSLYHLASPPQVLRHGAGNAGLGNDAGDGVVGVEDHHVTGAGIQQVVEALTGVVAPPRAVRAV